ncbi:FHIPEP family type III secretion protein [Kaustia mangrovi]|uniref:FHIPEP family type III secretion protein n=1 Tax=Kaustia mangrovi TaxID=2593653 RepID=A0A7S8C6P5_9HYPH|nr:flagellar biosynthesis protein FlhA [Kaustia mangrovi]QPC44332.1 FHIPEP family type III secretion protein [Kaustia mangrovi]
MTLSRLTAIAAQQKDIFLVAVFGLVLLMVILPLPTMAMDVMITLNISASIIIILMSLQMHNPVQFSTFPPILLVTTLFRLAISISTTRLILIEGDAGRIVETFGQVAVGGNLVVGLVIFLIITVVQFLVITKGADRVAEVGARFTLDGMPGKQMSVDADVRAGNMDQVDARAARQGLEREAKLFGAMDGAMKFVKGDAIAGLVITAINLLGGVAIGMFQRGLGFGEALNLYALLTVGDGLVAQIPALLISVAAGNMVTRVSSPKGMDLGTEITQQIAANHRTIITAGVVIALFGFVPGFPTVIFLAVGAAMAGGVAWTMRRQYRDVLKAHKDWRHRMAALQQEYADLEMRTGMKEALRLVLPREIFKLDVMSFCVAFDSIRDDMMQEYGLPGRHWRLEVDEDSEYDYRIYINQELADSGQFRMDSLFVKVNASYLDALGIPHIAGFGHRQGALVSAEYEDRLAEENIAFWPAMEQLLMHVKRVVVERLDILASFQNTAVILGEVQASNPALVGDLREAASNNQIAGVLRHLLGERIPVTSRVRILEAILKWSQRRPDPAYLVQKVRIEIADFITKRFADNGFLPVIVVSPTIESFMREGVRNTEEGNYLVLEPSVSAHIVRQARQICGEDFRRGRDPVLIMQQDVRYAMHNVLHEHGIYLPVLAYQEVTPETVIYPVGFLTADPAEGAQA